MLKLANRLRIPVVPRAGGTGLADGAVPLRGGILVDVKLMDQIKEIDLTDRTVTVGTGINMLKLNQELRPHGVFYPDDPASYPCSIVGGRIGTGGWSLLGGRLRAYARSRDLDAVRAPDRRDHRGRGRRRAQAAQVVDRLHAQAAVHGPPGNARDRHRGDARACQPSRDRVRGVLRLRRLHEGLPDDRQVRPLGDRDARRRGAVRRVEGALPAPRRRGLHRAARGRQGRGRGRAVRAARRGRAREQAGDGDRAQRGRPLPR